MLKKDGDLPPRQALTQLHRLLSVASHRDTIDGGCPLPYLAADAPRLAEPRASATPKAWPT
jgi:hypothetical protein